MAHGGVVKLAGDRLTDGKGRLAGAHIAMDTCIRNAIEFGDISPAQAVSMASSIPAKVLGMDDQLGHITPGYRASVTCLDADFKTTDVIVDGKHFCQAAIDLITPPKQC